MKLAWLTDLHLNFNSKPERSAFLDMVAEAEPDVVLIGGDIGESDTVRVYLEEIENHLQRDIFFVLGNHDFYGSSIERVRTEVSHLARKSPRLHWLPDVGVRNLSPTVALIGHGSWADGRFGNFMDSDLVLNDYVWITEFNPMLGAPEHVEGASPLHPSPYYLTGRQAKVARLKTLNRLGDQAAAHVGEILPRALAFRDQVIFLTHVPPFKEACWHEGRPSDDDSLPHFSCKAVGDTLVRIMKQHTSKRLTVLCGHTHGGAEAQILPNLTVSTGSAVYGRPCIQRIIDLP